MLRLLSELSPQHAELWWKTGSRLVGVIVVELSDRQVPCRYWSGAMVKDFSDRETERPYIYRTRKAAENRVIRCREECGGEWTLALWSHPEAGRTPLDRYLKMEGGKFPGSPTQ